MKNMILVLALSLISFNAFAGPRAFRVNRGTGDSMGYAIGWGVNGGNTDFESLDKLPSEELESFIENNDVRNYLVDLFTNQIILDLSGPDAKDLLDLEVGDIHWGNFFHISIGGMSHMYAQGREIVPVIHHAKWSSSLSHAVVTKRTTEGVQVIKDDQHLEERMLKTVLAKLTRSQKAKFEKGARTIDMEANEQDGTTEITWGSEVPKSMKDPYITVKAKVVIDLDDNDNILVKVLKVSYKEEK